MVIKNSSDYNKTMSKKIINDLKKILDKNSLLTEIEDIYSYSHDCNCNISKNEYPIAIALPSTIKEVQAIVKVCHQYKTPVIARGAGTNHVGGCVAKKGGVLIHFSKMNKILNISKENLNAIVQPGAIVGDIQDEAEKLGLFYPPDPSNLRVSTIGGALALSSGGPRGLKYGTAKDYILNLKVVLADGTLITTANNCSKSVAGYNFTQLFVGSEGTLGIIVEATLKLIPKPKTNNILLAYFDTIEDASIGVNKILEAGIIPSVIDLLDKFTLETIEDFIPTGLDTTKSAMLFIELDGDEISIKKDEEKILDTLKNAKLVQIKTEEEKQKFWTARRASFGATAKLKGNVITEDVVVPRTNIPRLITGIKEILKRNNLIACIMGHAGDGNIHPNFALDFSDKDEMQRFEKAKSELFELAISLDGTISGEHGIGFEKAKYMEKAIDKNVIIWSKKLKKIFDEHNILNPQKIYID